VSDTEPLHGRTICCSTNHVVCSPHIGPSYARGIRAEFTDIFDQILVYSAGAPINVVNPEVLTAIAVLRN
jgi:D-3-phosphoglycerate dehydrogenase / 2-oxoglutarate reductase